MVQEGIEGVGSRTSLRYPAPIIAATPVSAMSGCSQVLAQTMLGQAPHFSGRAHDWAVFEKEWEDYMGVLVGLNGDTPI